MRKALAIIIILSFSFFSIAQILNITPSFPTQMDDVTITYDASQGNSALVGVVPVYGHFGVITTESNSPGDWKNVVGNWGTADPQTLMTYVGDSKHEISFNITNFFNLSSADTVLQLSFVFRSADGSIVGRDFDGSDIFYSIFPDNASLQFLRITPMIPFIIAEDGQSIEVNYELSEEADMVLTDNGSSLVSITDNTLEYTITASPGDHKVIFTASIDEYEVKDTISYVVKPNVLIAEPPSNTEYGINYISDNEIVLKFYAPNKEFIYVVGDFNSWLPKNDYFCNLSSDSSTWWLRINNIESGTPYGFQYWVDGGFRSADPYAEVILTQYDDLYIPDSHKMGLPPYPNKKTIGNVSIAFPGKADWEWNFPDFQKPDKKDLVIYELLIRDFVANQSYQSLIDTLPYLADLGINAIELMPVNEFEGNLSWGYNPSHHMAIDKYYGSTEHLKEFIDSCHGRGIAVIMDVVFNHAFSQSPLCQLYWDDQNFRPTTDNPWLNVTAKHDYNVGFDFNHESQQTKYYVKRILSHLIEKFHVDGFRFDLSKGFTQKQTLGNVSAWGAYDPTRISILKDYADHIWSIDPDNYVILEHFADNTEEKELASYGMMLWGNVNYAFNQASMGYDQSNFSSASYQNRNWTTPHLIAYMESHDEERLMYKNLQYGNSDEGYNIKELKTALARQELATVFFYSIPGPKMLWQFGELGYEFSINTCEDGSVDDNCRLSPKPLHWDYNQDADRMRLHNITRAMLNLRADESAFSTEDFSINASDNSKKSIILRSDDMDVVILGNYGVIGKNIVASFTQTGQWYEYFSGSEISVSSLETQLELNPGEYRMYTTKKLPSPDIPIIPVDPTDPGIYLYPNPVSSNEMLWIYSGTGEIIKYTIYSLSGQKVLSNNKPEEAQTMKLDISSLSPGMYIIRAKDDQGLEGELKFMVF